MKDKNITLFKIGVSLLLLLCFQVSGAIGSFAQEAEPTVLLLWPEGAPGAQGTEPEDQPSITLYPASPDLANGSAVVVCPGGGYAHLAMDHEGRQVAEWLNTIGVSAYVLKYRLGPRYHHPAPLLDAQRAIRTVRSHAGEWNLDPSRIGILGFSAGGHLTTTAGTHLDDGDATASDPVDQVSSRPDFMIPIYPVVSLVAEYTHQGSKLHLLGENHDDDLARQLSNETQVTPRTPPTFLVHTTDDTVVPVENSIVFYQALRNAGVPVEMHIFETGPHGFGLAPDNPVLSMWSQLCEAWLRSQGLLDRDR